MQKYTSTAVIEIEDVVGTFCGFVDAAATRDLERDSQRRLPYVACMHLMRACMHHMRGMHASHACMHASHACMHASHACMHASHACIHTGAFERDSQKLLAYHRSPFCYEDGIRAASYSQCCKPRKPGDDYFPCIYGFDDPEPLPSCVSAISSVTSGGAGGS